MTARVLHPHRAYLLAAGPITNAVPGWGEEAPNLWWPEDRAWVVVSEIDYAWTYIGGSADLICSLIADARLEAMPAKLTDRPFYDADLLNAGLDLA